MALETAVLEELQGKLLAEKAELEAELSRMGTPTGAEGDYDMKFDNLGTDPDENATEVEEYVDTVAVEGSLEGRLKDVNDALAKMQGGAYGVCEKTGEEIPLERLMVYPAARTKVGV